MSNQKSKEKDEQFEALLKSNFKQQKLAAWRPVPTIKSTTLTFIIFGIIFIIIGVIVLVYSNKIQEYSLKYDTCTGNPCELELKVENEALQAPIMVYYQLNNFYQNHRRYVKSKSNKQLAGEILTAEDIKTDCEPVYLNEHLNVKYAIDGVTELKPKEPANPCGLIAKSLFNDTYVLTHGKNNSEIFINETGIAWASDITQKYKFPENGEKILWTNITDEHFMVWMRPAGLPNFRKLWGRINEDLEVGTYKVMVYNNFPVSDFEGSKYFVLSTVNALGGKNSFLGISYICVGSICFVMAILFFFGYKAHSKTN